MLIGWCKNAWLPAWLSGSIENFLVTINIENINPFIASCHSIFGSEWCYLEFKHLYIGACSYNSCHVMILPLKINFQPWIGLARSWNPRPSRRSLVEHARRSDGRRVWKTSLLRVKAAVTFVQIQIRHRTSFVSWISSNQDICMSIPETKGDSEFAILRQGHLEWCSAVRIPFAVLSDVAHRLLRHTADRRNNQMHLICILISISIENWLLTYPQQQREADMFRLMIGPLCSQESYSSNFWLHILLRFCSWKRAMCEFDWTLTQDHHKLSVLYGARWSWHS